MTPVPDPVVRTLDRRIDELELMIVKIIGCVAIAALVIGASLPWITEGTDEDARTHRLGTYVFGALEKSDGLEAAEVLLSLSFAVLDLTTIAAIVCVGYAMAGLRGRSWIGPTVIVLLVCCIAGAGLLTLHATTRMGEIVSGDLHWSGYLLWSLGALISMWLLTTRLGRRLQP